MKRMDGFLNVALLAALALCAGAVQAEEAVLWPSAATVMRAQRDSQIAPLACGALGVTTGAKERWPGVRMDFAAGEMDLSRFGRVTIAVSNTTDYVRTIHLSVKGVTQQGQSPGGSVTLSPHAAGEIVCDLHNVPWVLDAPVQFDGMRGYPTTKGNTTFDLRRTNSFHIFYMQDGMESGFSVSRVTASTDGVKQKKLTAATFFPFVDRFGQFKHDDWPGKVHSEAELTETKKKEDAWLAAHAQSPIPESDRYGGWAAGPKLKATGFFRTEKVRGKWWFVDPDGHLFFSHGVNCVDLGSCTTGITFRERYFEWLPAKDDPVFGSIWKRVTEPGAHGFYKDAAHLPYDAFCFANANMRRKYGPQWQNEFKERTHRRLHAWGLNTIANWSWEDLAFMDRTPYTLGLGTWGTPRLKGSTGYWGALPDPFTKEFEEVFRKRAREAGKRMKNDPWCVGIFVDNELSWNREPRMAEVSEQYFSTLRRILREELPNHLYLGCRLAWGAEAVYRASARHCDVVSVNNYGRSFHRSLPAGAVDKPMINGEFHFGALDRGMFHTGLAGTRDQEERAQCYRNFVNDCLDHPRLIGTHWFQWQNQALTGRCYDGENYQIGFLDVTDTPYPELVNAARDIARTMYRRRYGKE